VEGFELNDGGGTDITRQIREHILLTPEPEPDNNIDVDEISNNRHSFENRGGGEGVPKKAYSLARDLVRGGTEVL